MKNEEGNKEEDHSDSLREEDRNERTTERSYLKSVVQIIFIVSILFMILIRPVIAIIDDWLPFVQSPNPIPYALYFNTIAVLTAFYIIVTLTANLEFGNLGIPNFGKVGFIAVGSYSFVIAYNTLIPNLRIEQFLQQTLHQLTGDVPILTDGSRFVLSMLFAAVVTGLFGFLLTLPTLRLGESYLAIVTIVGGELVRIVVLNEEIFGGFNGIFFTNPINGRYNAASVKVLFPQIDMSYISYVLLLILFVVMFSSYLLFERRERSSITLEDQEFLGRVVNKTALYRTTVLMIGILALVVFLNYFGVFLNLVSLLNDLGISFLGDGQENLPRLGIEILGTIMIVNLVLYAKVLPYIRSVIQDLSYPVWFGIFTIGLAIEIIIIKMLEVVLVGSIISQGEISLANWYILWFAMGLAVGAFILFEQVYYSPMGRALRAIREDEASAGSVGKSVFHYRAYTLIIANTVTGLAGALFVYILAIVLPDSFLPVITFYIYTMLIVGGTGNNKGAIMGVLFYVGLFWFGEWLQGFSFMYPYTTKPIGAVNWALIILGVVLIVVLIFSPEGIFPERRYKINDYYYELLVRNIEQIEYVATNN